MSASLLGTVLPAGASWSRECRRGTALTLKDVAGGANVAALLYCAADPLERYSMPDTLKAQHISRLSSGAALHTDMGRALASITADTCGWHDTITGHAGATAVAERWGPSSFQQHGNEWRRSAREGLLVELAKHGLGRRDLVANVNFFTKVDVDEQGALAFVPRHSAPGATVTLRFELDTLVVLAHAPHPLDSAPEWPRGEVRLGLAESPQAGADDPVRTACAENERAFAATEASLR